MFDYTNFLSLKWSNNWSFLEFIHLNHDQITVRLLINVGFSFKYIYIFSLDCFYSLARNWIRKKSMNISLYSVRVISDRSPIKCTITTSTEFDVVHLYRCKFKPIDKRYMRSKWNGLLYKRASAMTLNLKRTNKMTFKITIAFNKLGSTLNFDTFSNV